MKLAKLSALATIIVITLSLVSGDEAQGQGILRRLQSRVQARRTLPPPPPAAQPGQTNPANGGAAASGPSPTVAPTPAPAAPSLSANGPRSQYAPLGSRDGRPDPRAAGNERAPQRRPQASPQRPNGPSNDENPSGGSYGGSILEFGFDEPEESEDAESNPRPSAARPTLGIDVSERRGLDGLQVSGFRPESRAAEYGLRRGDVILAMNDVPVRQIRDAADLLANTRLGESVSVRIRRGPRDATLNIPVVARVVSAAKPPIEDSSTGITPQVSREMAASPNIRSAQPGGPIGVADLGIEPDTATKSRARGVPIASVVPASPAALAGIQAGDRLVSIDGRLLINLDTLGRELGRFPSGKEVSTRVVRNGKLLQNRVTLLPQSQWPDESQVADTSSSSSEGSVLGGLGSALGGWFGGKSSAKTEDSQTAPTAATKSKPADVDEMALGDEWDPGVDGDPQSLESLAPPAEPTGAVEAKIERLERELRALKAKAASGS